MESDVLRADEDEALAHAIAAKGAELSVNRDGRWELIGTIDGPIRFSDPGLQRANVFCMHAFPSSRVEDLVDQRNFGFGDTYVVFTEGDEFLRRVRAEALRLKIELQCSLVEYVDPSTYRGAMGIFRKFSSFSYQSECRLALLPGTGEPYSLWVGEGSCQSGRYRTSRRPLLWPTRAEHRGPAAGVGAHRRAV
jgi:hypothetical protein